MSLETSSTPISTTVNNEPLTKLPQNEDSKAAKEPETSAEAPATQPKVEPEAQTIKKQSNVTKKSKSMKKKKKASMLARRRRGGVESEDEGSLDAPQSDSSETDDSEEDQRDEDEEDDDDSSSESDSEDGSEEENESQVDSDEDESTETKVEPAETSKAKPNPLENSNLTDPTTIAESLANISISKDWAEEAQEEENKQASSNKLPKQDSTPSTDLSNSSEIPKSKKSKSQRRREAKAKAKSLASSEAPPQAEAQQPQPIRTNANVTFPTSRTNPKISPRNGSLGNHADRASVASSGGLGAGRRGGAPPSAPSVRGALNGNGSRLLEMNGRGGMSGSRGGKGGSFSRGGGRGGSNSNSSTRGKGRMMSWSDDEEDGNGNSLVVDEDALEGKVVKTLPKELRIPTGPKALRGKQFPNHSPQPARQSSSNLTPGSTAPANANGANSSSRTESSISQTSSPIPTGPSASSSKISSTNNSSEAPSGKWDHDAFESLAANGRLDRRGVSRRGGRASLNSRTAPSGNGQVPPLGPRSMSSHSQNRLPQSNGHVTSTQDGNSGDKDPRAEANQLVASQASGNNQVKVKFPSQFEDQVSGGIQSTSQAQEAPKLPDFPASTPDQRAQQPTPQQRLASLPPGFAMDSTGVVFDLRGGGPVAVGFMDEGNGGHGTNPYQQPPHHYQQHFQPENKHLSSISRQSHSRSPSSIPHSAVKAPSFYPGSSSSSNPPSSYAGSEGGKTPASKDQVSENREASQNSDQTQNPTSERPQNRYYTSNHRSQSPFVPNHDPRSQVNPYSHQNHPNYYNYSIQAPLSPYDHQSMYHQQMQAQFAYEAAAGTPPHPLTPLYGTPPATAYNPYAHPPHTQDQYFSNPQAFDPNGYYQY